MMITHFTHLTFSDIRLNRLTLGHLKKSTPAGKRLHAHLTVLRQEVQCPWNVALRLAVCNWDNNETKMQNLWEEKETSLHFYTNQ